MKRLLAVSAFVAIGLEALPAFSQPPPAMTIHVLEGRFDANPVWTDGEFENENNHSLVTRVAFGTASFLVMGDLEEAGIELLVSQC